MMKNLKNSRPPKFTAKEIKFFERLNRRGSIFSEYRRLFNISLLVGVTWGVVFLSTVI